MPTVDLDAARAARAEARGESTTVVVGGREYELSPELPVEFAEHMRFDRIKDALGTLLADPDDLEAFWATRPTIDDVIEIARTYGVDLGEFMASSTSSNGTSRPARPTSKRTTASTSGKRSGAKPR